MNKRKNSSDDNNLNLNKLNQGIVSNEKGDKQINRDKIFLVNKELNIKKNNIYKNRFERLEKIDKDMNFTFEFLHTNINKYFNDIMSNELNEINTKIRNFEKKFDFMGNKSLSKRQLFNYKEN